MSSISERGLEQDFYVIKFMRHADIILENSQQPQWDLTMGRNGWDTILGGGWVILCNHWIREILK